MKTRVAVYMGSFNPMHKGHIAVISYLLDMGGFDKVYLIVSPHNPFKNSAVADNAAERFAAAVDAVQRNGMADRVKVDDIEFSMPLPSYSVRTLDALSQREPDKRFVLVVGGDNLHELPLWKEGQRIMEQYGVVVYPREGYDIAHDCRVLKREHSNAAKIFNGGTGRAKPYHIQLLEGAPLVNVSSTQIREMIARGEDASGLLA